MNKKQAKAMKKGYKEAGVIYWTNDMKRAIQKIHLARIAWKIIAITELFIIAAGIFIWIR